MILWAEGCGVGFHRRAFDFKSVSFSFASSFSRSGDFGATCDEE